MNAPDSGDDSGRRPIYSIGAVARMLVVETATLRAWEERYGVIAPTRSHGGQRLYSRDELDQLRFVLETISAGTSPADAHRLLAERLGDEEGHSGSGADRAPVILVAERDRYAADLVADRLRSEGYEVCVAFDAVAAEEILTDRRPSLAIVDLMLSGGGLDLCERVAGDGDTPVLAMAVLDLADEALAAGADAFMAKPVAPRQLASTVRQLLSTSAPRRRSTVAVS